ncbi:MAG: hypothetical protein ACTHL8_24665 [Burkholderiaceae bacterium]
MPPPSWVGHAVVEMRQSPEYQSRIVDGWYETLPIPAWNERRTWLVVGFGKTTRIGSGPLAPVQAQAPHIACVTSYPDGLRQWSGDDMARRVWPTHAGDPEPAFPPPMTGGSQQRRERYYALLSDALSHGAFAARAAADPVAACAAARAARQAFLPAATHASLALVYATPLHDMDGWLATHCAKP